MAASLLYAYGVLGAAGSTAVSGVAGVGGRAVETVAGAHLALAVSPVPAADFDEEELDRRLQDPDWAARLATAHFEAVAEIHARLPVLPLRMCTVFRSAANAVATLDATTAVLTEALAKVEGCSEWAVTVRGVREPAAARSPDATSGAEYLRRVAARGRQREEAAAAARDEAVRLHAALTEIAVAALPAGDSAGVGVKQAYLVRREDTDDFVATLSRPGPDGRRLELDLRGPWPAYSFVPALREAA
jgi:hypothetical protein